jgi:hypothetical protein
LNAIHDEYIDWQEETGVRLIAVSVDDERTKNRVKPYVDASGWEYSVDRSDPRQVGSPRIAGDSQAIL